jgi:hypothetical protein
VKISVMNTERSDNRLSRGALQDVAHRECREGGQRQGGGKRQAELKHRQLGDVGTDHDHCCRRPD